MSISAAIKTQLLGVLLDALATPVASGQSAYGQKAAGTGLANLGTNETLTATVQGVKPDGRLILTIKGQTIEADVKDTLLPETARLPGARLQLRVETLGETLRLAFVGLASSPGLTNSSGVAQLASGPSPAGQNPATPALESLAGLTTVRIVNGTAAPQLSSTAAPVNPVTVIISRATVEAASRQGSAAPLYADLAALANRTDAPLPRPIATIVQTLLANRLDGEASITAADLKQAIARSGVFQEPNALDAKALLTALRDTLRGDSIRNPALPASDSEPPRRDGAVAAQRPVAALLAREADPQIISSTIAREADRAVERLTLHQIASLPDPQKPLTSEGARPQQLSFELPIALAQQQTALAGFRIEREKRRTKEANQSVDVWGVRFAIDADVLGPVHAHLRLAGPRISVSLWAEDATTHAAFVASIPLLEATLAENALEIGEVRVFPGRPAEPRPAMSGHFLDRRS